jgi:hypothetical protein
LTTGMIRTAGAADRGSGIPEVSIASGGGAGGSGISSVSGVVGGTAVGGAGVPLPLPTLLNLAPDFAAAFPRSPDAGAIKEAIIAEFLRDRYACTPDDLDAVVGSVVRTSSAVQSVYVELSALGGPWQWQCRTCAWDWGPSANW